MMSRGELRFTEKTASRMLFEGEEEFYGQKDIVMGDFHLTREKKLPLGPEDTHYRIHNGRGVKKFGYIL